VAGLVVVLLVAAAVFGVRVVMARAASEPEPLTPSTSGATLLRGSTFTSATTGRAGGGGPPAQASGTVTVHVVGQVAKPGVVRLPAGARVTDAIAKAGGAREGADLSVINLARPVADGEQVRVPKPGEVLPGAGSAGGTAAGGAGGATGSGGVGGGGSGAGAPGGTGAAGGLVNLNTATAAQLEELPGVGPVLAQRILDWRTEHGRFTTVDELGEVSGIGEKIFAQLQPKVTV
jgi:competence protein ComEA